MPACQVGGHHGQAAAPPGARDIPRSVPGPSRLAGVAMGGPAAVHGGPEFPGRGNGPGRPLRDPGRASRPGPGEGHRGHRRGQDPDNPRGTSPGGQRTLSLRVPLRLAHPAWSGCPPGWTPRTSPPATTGESSRSASRCTRSSRKAYEYRSRTQTQPRPEPQGRHEPAGRTRTLDPGRRAGLSSCAIPAPSLSAFSFSPNLAIFPAHLAAQLSEQLAVAPTPNRVPIAARPRWRPRAPGEPTVCLVSPAAATRFQGRPASLHRFSVMRPWS